MKFLIPAAALFLIAATAPSAFAQTQPPSPTISQLLTAGFELKAASSNGAAQFLYLQGVAKNGRKTIYACQLQFGSNGGFQGCLALP